MMHWTLQVMFALCAACFILNMVQYAMVGSVRFSGLIICYMWAMQQMIWEVHKDVPVFTLGCDLIVGYILWASRLTLTDKIILTVLPLTSLCTIFEWWHGGHTTMSWWINRSLVAGQMFLGLPCPKWQRGRFSFSHGPLRCEPGGIDWRSLNAATLPWSINARGGKDFIRRPIRRKA